MTDIFAPNQQAAPSPSKNQFYKQIAQFQVIEDHENSRPQASDAAAVPAQHGKPTKQNNDSGYHGATDDEMDLDRFPLPKVDAHDSQVMKHAAMPPVEECRNTEDEETYMSAKESFGSKGQSNEISRKGEDGMRRDEDMDVAMEGTQTENVKGLASDSNAHSPLAEPTATAPKDKAPTEPQANEDLEDEDAGSLSNGPSPVQPILRKSSLNFSALPAREPLTAMKPSVGPQAQRTSFVDQVKAALGRGSYLGRFTGGKSLGGSQNLVNMAVDNVEDRMDVDPVDQPDLDRQESETTRLHNKTSTQRLHDRINMLGQTKNIRSSKSIPNLYPQLPVSQEDKQDGNKAPKGTSKPADKPANVAQPQDVDDNDWIAPVKGAEHNAEAVRSTLAKSYTAEAVERIHGKSSVDGLQTGIQPAQHQSPPKHVSPSKRPLFGYKKNTSTTALPSPTKAAMAMDPPQKPISVSNPNPSVESFTPVGSPKRIVDGPLSASKAKLYSVLRSAKGIFASSAGVSAQAKMEALSPPPPPKHQPWIEGLASPRPDIIPAPSLYPNLQASKNTSVEPEGRRTRSSSEREQKRKEEEARQRQKVEDQLEKAREKERLVAAAAAAKKTDRPDSPSKRTRAEAERSKETLTDSSEEMPPPPPAKSHLHAIQPTKLGEPRRVVKPVQAAPPAKAKPAPVTVRMPSQRIGQMAPNNTALASSLNESLAPPPPPKQPAITTKPSNASLHSLNSNTSLKGTASSQSARRAMGAAAKKKEQEMKLAQRKAEQKRELEQKRQAKLEEERRIEQQRKIAEQQRVQEAKKVAQRQAAEAKRLEQQRKDTQRPASRQQNDLANAMQQDRMHVPPPAHPRADVGSSRPLAKLPLVQDQSRPAIHINPAKPPAKRPMQAEPEEEYQQRPANQHNPPSYQQMDAKRRKTENEENEPVDQRRSVMAPPIRQSNTRKVRGSVRCDTEQIADIFQEPHKFPHGYMQAPSHAQHQPSMLVKTVTAQHHQQHHTKSGTQQDMTKFANARIPFAEAPNPSAGPSTQNGHFKTPARPDPNFAAKSAAKSSPFYPPSESIALPDVATDSEDEGSENEFQAPAWANSPALRELLTQQQLIDPEQIFGPIAPLQMEEVFRNKERHKRFRERTSSAVWANDKVTEEERRKDREARERLIKDGGWTFQPGS